MARCSSDGVLAWGSCLPGCSKAIVHYVSTGIPPRSQDTPPHDSIVAEADLLLLTALTEEAQVAASVLGEVAVLRETVKGVRTYDYKTKKGVYRVAAASAHQMGATPMGVFLTRILGHCRPRCAALVGIAAAVDPSAVSVGDVPFASQVYSYDDIAVQDGILSFRNSGFQVDPAMRTGAGELRLGPENYVPWQVDCRNIISKVVGVLDQLRRKQIVAPKDLGSPHLVVDVSGSGPFLLRDNDFRDSLRKRQDIPGHHKIKVDSPVHPKLVSAEMEAHGFMRAAHELGMPAAILKGISDDGDQAKAELEKQTGGFFRAYACSNAVLAALHILSLSYLPKVCCGGSSYPSTSQDGMNQASIDHSAGPIAEYERLMHDLSRLRRAGLETEIYHEAQRKIVKLMMEDPRRRQP